MFELFMSDSFCCFGLLASFSGKSFVDVHRCTVPNPARGYAEVGRSRETFFGIVRKEAKNFTSHRTIRFNFADGHDYDYVRSPFLRYGGRARIRRIHNPGCRQTRLQIAPNRAQLGARPGLYDGDIGDADYDDKG